jgi:hypothetical protein
MQFASFQITPAGGDAEEKAQAFDETSYCN